MRNWLQKLVRLTDLCLESACPLCQRSTADILCLSCQQQLRSLQLADPQQFWQPPLPVFAWGPYSGPLKRAIKVLKYENQPQLAAPLGSWLAQQWLTSALKTRAIGVVPIPMHLEKQQQRGFNQAELLAKAFCHHTGLPLRHGLSRKRPTEAQFGLAAVEREQNLADAFELGQDFLSHSPTQAVLLLDDIYTTGATARSAAQLLRRHQISVRGIVVMAKA